MAARAPMGTVEQMPRLCITTALHEPNLAWVAELADSIAALELPQGWELVWSVQHDGPGQAARDLVTALPFAAYHADEARRGAAVSRQLALHRAGGDVVVNLDQDDVARPGLVASLELLDAHPELGWATGPVDDMDEDSRPSPFPAGLSGLVAPGRVSARWRTDRRLPLHTAGLAVRTELWLAVAGWVAGPTMSDDTAAFLAVSDLWPGRVHNEVVARWRIHPGQSSQQPRHTADRHLAWGIIDRRLAAMSARLRAVPLGDPLPER